MDDAFSSWTWDILLWAGGFALVVFLFMGPVMWSSTNEFMITRLLRYWRRPRDKRGEAEAPPR